MSEIGQVMGAALVEQGLMAVFLESLDVMPSSRALYARTLKLWKRWLAQDGQSLTHPHPLAPLRYKRSLEARGLSELSIASYLTVLKAFYRFLEQRGVAPDITRHVKSTKRYHGFRKIPLETAEIDLLLAAIPQDTLQGARDFALIQLLLRTGLRTIEAERANLDDITTRKGRTVLRVQDKGSKNKNNFVVLTDKTLAAIEHYLSLRPAAAPSAPLFAAFKPPVMGERLSTRSIRGIVKYYFRKIGLDDKRLSAHSLRHTAGVHIMKHCRDLYTTQLFMRHKTPATTQIYLKTAEEQFRLSTAPEQWLDLAY